MDRPAERPYTELEHDGFGRGTNQGGMRESNERLVLTVLRHSPSITKAEIARTTGLSAQTVARLIGALEADNLILRGKPNRGRIGQPSIPLSLNPEGAVFLGLKVGRRSADLVAIDFLGNVLDREQRLHGYPNFDEVRAFAIDASHRMRKKLPARLRPRVAGLGIAMPFHLWNWAQRIGVNQGLMSDWEHRDLKEEVASALDIDVFLQNDATAACSAEMVFGKAPLSSNTMSFYVGFFVGGGLVINDSLYTGATGNAGGLGPVTVTDRTGSARQLIELASLSNLETRLREAGLDTQQMWTDPETWDFRNDLVDAWCFECAHGMASAIRTAQSLLDLNTVMIDGWLPRDILKRLTQTVREVFEQSERSGIATPDIVEGTVGKDARTIGAGSLPLRHRYLLL